MNKENNNITEITQEEVEAEKPAKTPEYSVEFRIIGGKEVPPSDFADWLKKKVFDYTFEYEDTPSKAHLLRLYVFESALSKWLELNDLKAFKSWLWSETDKRTKVQEATGRVISNLILGFFLSMKVAFIRYDSPIKQLQIPETQETT